MIDYKNLNLQRASITVFVSEFTESKSLNVRSDDMQATHRRRITIGKAGIESAIIDLHLNQDGSTTVQYKLGKNQPLGEELATHLYNTINPDEFINVAFSLKGIYESDIDPILDELTQSKNDDGSDEFSTEVTRDDSQQKTSRITSIQHHDTLTISHYKTTHTLLIQGKPLHTYRKAIYLISELLDLAGLQSVLSRTETDTASIVRKEVANDYLLSQLPDSYKDLPITVQNLLLAGCCVKLASPQLPEYSMLLFPDLRGLEGVLRKILGEFGMYPGEEDHGFGAFFEVQHGTVKLSEEHHDKVDNADMMNALVNAYAFFRKHRHSLFHMDDFVEASRCVDTLDKALCLSKDCYVLINEIYKIKAG